MPVLASEKPTPRLSAVERWLTRVEIDENGCWLWQGALDRKGYGHVSYSVNGVEAHARVHRVFYEHLVGPLARDMQLDHLCRVRHCANPKHLEPVTHAENLRRGVGMGGLRSKGSAAENAAKTHCKRGHPFDEANTRITKSGTRACRACLRIHDRKRRPRAKK